jgi:hypothetical protein
MEIEMLEREGVNGLRKTHRKKYLLLIHLVMPYVTLK